MLGTTSKNSSCLENIKIQHPQTQKLISLKVDDLWEKFLSECENENISHAKYSVHLGKHNSLDSHLLSTNQEEPFLYIFKIEKIIAKALSSFLGIEPPLENLKEFGLYIKTSVRKDDHTLVMSYASKYRSEEEIALEFSLSDIPTIPCNRLTSQFEPMFETISLEELAKVPLYQEVFYAANDLFNSSDENLEVFTQKFMYALEETQNSHDVIFYLRNLFANAFIPVEEVLSLLKGVFVLLSDTCNVTSSRIRCTFNKVPLNIPRIEGKDLRIQDKYFSADGFQKLTERLSSKIPTIYGKYLAKPDLSIEEFQWIVEKADFTAGPLTLNTQEHDGVLENVQKYSLYSLGPDFAKQLKDLVPYVKAPTKLVCGTLRTWIANDFFSLENVSSEVWDLLQEALIGVLKIEKKPKAWNELLSEISEALHELPNRGLAKFLKTLLANTQYTPSSSNDLVWNSIDDLTCVRMYKDLYQIPKIAKSIEENYLFSREHIHLEELRPKEKLGLQSAIESRIFCLLDEQKIEEAFLLLKHLYGSLGKYGSPSQEIAEIFQHPNVFSSLTENFLTSMQRHFPGLEGEILPLLQGKQPAENIWISLLSDQSVFPIAFPIKKQAILRLLDQGEVDNSETVISGLLKGTSKDEALFFLEECIARFQKTPNTAVHELFAQVLIKDSDQILKKKNPDLKWMKGFFHLLNNTENLTEVRFKFLCSHMKNHSLIEVGDLMYYMVSTVKNQEYAIALLNCIKDQIGKVLETKSQQAIFASWSFFMKEPLLSFLLENKQDIEVFSAYFSYIKDNIHAFISTRNMEGINELQEYLKYGSLEEKSLLLLNSIKHLQYAHDEIKVALLQAIFLEETTEKKSGAIRDMILSQQEGLPKEEDWLLKGLAFVERDESLRKGFVEAVLKCRIDYPNNFFKKIALVENGNFVFLNENSLFILEKRVEAKIKMFKEHFKIPLNPNGYINGHYKVNKVNENYFTSYKDFIIFITLPEFAFLAQEPAVYAEIFEMAWWILRDPKGFERTKQFFTQCFELALKKIEIPEEIQSETEVLRLSVALECAADSQLSSEKEQKLLDALCACSEETFKEISERSLYAPSAEGINTGPIYVQIGDSGKALMPFKSRLLALKALEQRCKSDLNPSKVIFDRIHAHLVDSTNSINSSLFSKYQDTFDFFAQFIIQFASYNSERIGACAGELIMLFLIHAKKIKSIETMHFLFKDVLEFRLRKGLSPTEDSLLYDFHTYCAYPHNVLCGETNEVSEIIKKDPSKLLLDDALIIQLITYHQDVKKNALIVPLIQKRFKDILKEIKGKIGFKDLETSVTAVLSHIENTSSK